MPCWTVTTAEIALGKVDQDLLSKAMADLKIRRWNFNAVTNTLFIEGQRSSDELTAKVKVAYSRQVVLSQATKFRWHMKEVAPNKWEVTR